VTGTGILRPERRSTVSSAPQTIVAPGGTSGVRSNPKRIRLPCSADQVARFRTRWSWVKRRSVPSQDRRGGQRLTALELAQEALAEGPQGGG
jgi:hypothetical protein